MILGIIAAMGEELEPLLNDMELKGRNTIANITFNEGNLYGQDVVGVVCGIGKVNAAICSQILISTYKVDKIINIGVAGGVSNDLQVGDIVVGEKLVQHDFDITAFNHEKGYIPNLGGKFIDSCSELIE